eukprot:scaffold223119_cov18-Prasinocladus_malaysianus.AAC.1
MTEGRTTAINRMLEAGAAKTIKHWLLATTSLLLRVSKTFRHQAAMEPCPGGDYSHDCDYAVRGEASLTRQMIESMVKCGQPLRDIRDNLRVSSARANCACFVLLGLVR